MEVLSFIIIAFTIYSIIASVNTKGGNLPRGRTRFPGEIKFPQKNQFPPEIRFPQSGTTEYRETQRSEETDARNSSASGQNLDPYKDMELAQAQGYEGEWGDEGRPTNMRPAMSDEGSIGVEGSVGTEGIAGTEGSAGTEGIFVPQKKLSTKEKANLRTVSSAAATGVWDNELSMKDLVRGVIWSEVLGRPRAMKPHRGPRG